MSLSVNFNIYIGSRLVSINWFISSLWVTFYCSFACLVIFFTSAWHCEFYFVCWLFCIFIEYSWYLLWGAVKLLGTCLNLSILLLKFVRWDEQCLVLGLLFYTTEARPFCLINALCILKFFCLADGKSIITSAMWEVGTPPSNLFGCS